MKQAANRKVKKCTSHYMTAVNYQSILVEANPGQSGTGQSEYLEIQKGWVRVWSDFTASNLFESTSCNIRQPRSITVLKCRHLDKGEKEQQSDSGR
jgi:hypothetical protein